MIMGPGLKHFSNSCENSLYFTVRISFVNPAMISVQSLTYYYRMSMGMKKEKNNRKTSRFFFVELGTRFLAFMVFIWKYYSKDSCVGNSNLWMSLVKAKSWAVKTDTVWEKVYSFNVLVTYCEGGRKIALSKNVQVTSSYYNKIASFLHQNFVFIKISMRWLYSKNYNNDTLIINI